MLPERNITTLLSTAPRKCQRKAVISAGKHRRKTREKVCNGSLPAWRPLFQFPVRIAPTRRNGAYKMKSMKSAPQKPERRKAI